MRGAQPDAVCPRCAHRQPPSDSPLAHCAQCGLTFQPKEIFVRTKRPTAPPEEEVFDGALVVTPPAALAIEDTGEDRTYTWADSPHLFTIVSVVGVIVGVLLWMSDVARNDKIGHTIGLIVIALTAHFQSKPSVKLRIAKNHLVSGRGMFLLSEIKRVELFGSKLYAITRDDKELFIVEAKDREIAAYLNNTLRLRLEGKREPNDANS